MRRYDAIKAIIDCIDDGLIISCDGMISRELFSVKDRVQNFYMLGSMGLASAIGLGVALARSDEKIIVLTGDGNMLMSLGTLATIGMASPKNIIHIVLDNECHESTGGQETASKVAKLCDIARFSGFINSECVSSLNALKNALRTLLGIGGPSFIHVKVSKERVDAPRVSIDPVEIKDRFMKESARV
jgi:thiamine pyrophosphate-dependent acetolactate synthase large subunit-like protein